MTRTWLKIALIFFVFAGSANFQRAEKKSFSCKRIVKEKDRCLIYNYTHPNCKKWDRSNCPPPRIHRERGPCVSYKCTPLAGWAASQTTTPVPVIVTTSTTPIQSRNVSEAQEFQASTAQAHASRVEDVEKLQNEIDALKLAQSEDVNRLEEEKQNLSDQLNGIRQKVLQHTNKITKVEEETDSVWETLHAQELQVEEDLQNLEDKVFQTNFTTFRRLLNLERQVADLHSLVQRLNASLAGSQVYKSNCWCRYRLS